MNPTEILIHDDALTHNFRLFKQHFSDSTLVPVIKSDGYGHGLIETARAFIKGGAAHLAVFRVEEALNLREAGIQEMIWVLLGALPEEAEAAQKIGGSLRLACPSLESARALSKVAQKTGGTFHLHLKVDTGMGRLGFVPVQVPEVMQIISSLPGLKVHGVFSHCAQGYMPDGPVTKKQVAAFRSMLPILPPTCIENHLAASDALLEGLCPELHYARPGICLYGAAKFPGFSEPMQGAMTLRTHLISVKDLPAQHNISYNCLHTLDRASRIAVAPVGYADGFPRELSEKGYALVHGRRVPILGQICMSMMMLDVTDIPETVLPGDEAVLLGKQGKEEISIYEMAKLAHTTPHVPLCHIGTLAAANRIHA